MRCLYHFNWVFLIWRSFQTTKLLTLSLLWPHYLSLYPQVAVSLVVKVHFPKTQIYSIHNRQIKKDVYYGYLESKAFTLNAFDCCYLDHIEKGISNIFMYWKTSFLCVCIILLWKHYTGEKFGLLAANSAIKRWTLQKPFSVNWKMLLSLFCTQADTSSFPQLHPWFTQAAADSGLLPPP